jgi:hypothetical protein
MGRQTSACMPAISPFCAHGHHIMLSMSYPVHFVTI